MSKSKNFSLKRGDLVRVIAGSKKGLISKILLIDSKKNKGILRIKEFNETIPIAESLNKKKQTLISVHISNLMSWEPNLKKVSRIGFLFLNNKKERYFKKSGKILLENKNIENE